jgi:hypothetical protein
MEKIVVKGTKEEVIKAMEEKGYHMEGFNEVSIKARYFYAYRPDYQGAEYFTIKKKPYGYIITQY